MKTEGSPANALGFGEKAGDSDREAKQNLPPEEERESESAEIGGDTDADDGKIPEKAPFGVPGGIVFHLNGAPLRLPPKEGNVPYYLMDMIQYSGIDLKNPKGRIELTVNGEIGMFQQELKAGDNIRIQEEYER